MAFAQSEETLDSATADGLEEVTVTAARREESTQEAWLSLQAISGDETRTRGAGETTTLCAAVGFGPTSHISGPHQAILAQAGASRAQA